MVDLATQTFSNITKRLVKLSHDGYMDITGAMDPKTHGSDHITDFRSRI